MSEPVAASRPCPFCAEDVKAAAIKCKHCGSRLDEPAPPARRCPSCGNGLATDASGCARCGTRFESGPVVTERTSKRLKLQHLAASALLVVGFVAVVIDCNVAASEGGDISPASILVFAIGLIAYIASRVRIWWHHH